MKLPFIWVLAGVIALGVTGLIALREYFSLSPSPAPRQATASPAGARPPPALGESTSLQNTPATERLVVQPRRVDLGRIGHMEKRSVPFTVRNPGPDSVVLEKVTRSCDCMTVTLATGTLGPGQETGGTLVIDLGRGFGSFDKHLDLHLAGHAPVVIPVHATFHPGLSLSAQNGKMPLREFVLTGVVGGAIPEDHQSAVLSLANGVPQVEELGVYPVRSQDPHAGLRVSQARAGSGVLITVEVLSTHPAGRIAGDVKALVDGLTMVIPVRGLVHRGLRYEPENFNFSRIDVPATARLEVLVTATDARPFRILKIQVVAAPGTASDAVRVEAEPRPDGGVVLVASTRGDLEPGARLYGEVVLHTDHPDCQELKLNYMGFTPPTDGKRKP